MRRSTHNLVRAVALADWVWYQHCHCTGLTAWDNPLEYWSTDDERATRKLAAELLRQRRQELLGSRNGW